MTRKNLMIGGMFALAFLVCDATLQSVEARGRWRNRCGRHAHSRVHHGGWNCGGGGYSSCHCAGGGYSSYHSGGGGYSSYQTGYRGGYGNRGWNNSGHSGYSRGYNNSGAYDPQGYYENRADRAFGDYDY